MHGDVTLIGGSGYTGVEATRLLAEHRHVEVRHVVSDRWQGELLGDRLNLSGPIARLRYAPMSEAFDRAVESRVVLLATPVEASLELAPALHARGVRVIDLSGAFRLKSFEAFQGVYGLAHGHRELLQEAEYGLTELRRARLSKTQLVANPGCYPTATLLALAPLLESRLLSDEGIVVNAASGTTGAGRKGSEELAFSEVSEDFRAYKVLRHQHGPEIQQVLEEASGRKVPLTFTAHLLPVRRGILVTAYARVQPGLGQAELQSTLVERYLGCPFIRVKRHPDEVHLKDVVGTNQCHIALAVDPDGTDPGRVVVVSAIDNLLKGAAGQAIQNLNLALGLRDDTGLERLGRAT